MLYDDRVERIKKDLNFDRIMAEIIVDQNRRLDDASLGKLVDEVKKNIDPSITGPILGSEEMGND